MDTIRNTQEAIDHYSRLIKKDLKNEGEFYLEAYGLFESFVVQQNAIKHMAESLDYKNLSPANKLDLIKDIRVFGFGHPTNCTSRKDMTYNSVFNTQNSRTNFDIYSYNNTGQLTITKVNIPNLINDQKNDIIQEMTEILDYIKLEDKKHKSKFMNIKLAKCFDVPDVFYDIEKLIESIKPNGRLELGKLAVKNIKQALNNFSDRLEERQCKLDFYPGINLSIKNTIFPIEWLNDFFDNKNHKKDNYNIAEVFIDYL